MFKRILVPVDLEHADELAKALDVAQTMANSQDAELVYVSIFHGEPSSVARNEAEFTAALEEFVAYRVAQHGLKARALPLASVEAYVELTDLLLDAARRMESDLIVMASHMPGWLEHIFHSNAGYVAAHAPISVLVVR